MRLPVIFTAIAGIGVAGVVPNAALAREGLEYTYLQLDYVGRDIDSVDDMSDTIEDIDDGSGLALKGQYAFSERIFGFATYSETESDVSYSSEDVFPLPADTEVKRLDVGIGTSIPINDRLDFLGRLAYSDIDFDAFEFGATSDLATDDLTADDSDGYFLDGGVRAQLAPNLEGTIGVRYTDIQEIDNTSLIGSLLFEVSPSWGVNLSLDAGDEIATYELGVRFTPDS